MIINSDYNSAHKRKQCSLLHKCVLSITLKVAVVNFYIGFSRNLRAKIYSFSY